MFSESLKQTETLKGTLYGYFNNVSSYFKKEEEKSVLMENSNENELHKMEMFYRVCLEDVKNMKNKMVNVFIQKIFYKFFSNFFHHFKFYIYIYICFNNI